MRRHGLLNPIVGMANTSLRKNVDEMAWSSYVDGRHDYHFSSEGGVLGGSVLFIRLSYLVISELCFNLLHQPQP